MPLPLYPFVTTESKVRSFGGGGREEEKKKKKRKKRKRKKRKEKKGERDGQGRERKRRGGMENLLGSSEIEGVKVKGSGA